MNKCVKLILFIPVFLLFAVCFSINASAESNYVFKDFHIRMDVGEDNSYRITETINCHFTKTSHGIYRKIPHRNKVTRANGSETFNKALITDISCNEQYTTSIEGDYLTLKIGDPNSYADEDVQYIINYTYNIGKDNNTEFDELYFNLYGTEWENTAEHVSFEINMPKKFNSEKLGFSYGLYRSTNSENINYKVDGNKITGELLIPLASGEGLTVRCELPEGYFSKAESNTDYTSLLFFVLSAICFTLIILMFILNLNSKKKYAPTIEFYPPENLLCTDLACVIDGKVDAQQMIAVVFHLAQKGYIKIQDGYDTSPSRKKTKNTSYCFIRVKDYDENNYIERIVFEGLFASNKNFANSTTLGETFSHKLNKAIDTKYKPTKKNVIGKNFYDCVFKRNFFNYKNISILLLVIVGIVGIILPNLFYYGKFESAMISNLIEYFQLIFMTIFLIVIVLIRPVMKKSKSKKFPFVVAAIVTVLALFCFNSEKYSAMQKLSIKGSMIFLAAGFVIVTKIQGLRTNYGNELYAKTVGFRNFLELAEKPKLEELVEHNPDYFFDILPYAFTLGVSDKWIEKFTSMFIPKPDWYITDNYNDFTCWHYMYHNTYFDMVNNITPNGVGMIGAGMGSGGGSSGGGSGGGGGGSW